MTIKAFIVEDSAVIRENLIHALQEMSPVEVVGTAEDELTAVAWLDKPDNACDLVVIDIFLKGGSGLGVLRAMSDSRRTLVVLSNYLSSVMREKCLDLGANQVFDKSNEIDALLAYCARLADGKTDQETISSRG